MQSSMTIQQVDHLGTRNKREEYLELLGVEVIVMIMRYIDNLLVEHG